MQSPNSSQGSNSFRTLEDRARAYDLGARLLEKIIEQRGATESSSGEGQK